MTRKAMSYKVWLPSIVAFLIVLFMTRGTGELSVVFAVAALMASLGLLLRDDAYARSCPHCRSPLRTGAGVCADCGRRV